MQSAEWLIAELGLSGTPGVMDETYVRERLHRHLPADAHGYVLALVASAVAADASYLKIQNDSDDFILLRDGRTPNVTELDTLFSNILGHAGAPERGYLVDLALGLCGSLALQPRSVTVETWSSAGGHRYLLQPNGHKVDALKTTPFQDPRATFRIHVKETRKLTKLLKLVSGFPPEGELISKRCMYATPKITVNGTAVNRKLDLGRCVVSSRWSKIGIPMPGEAVIPGSIERNGPSPGEFASYLGLGRPAEEHQTWFLVDGVCLLDPDPDLPFRELRGLVCCPGLKHHLNLSGVIEDEHYQALLEHLRAQVVEMAHAAATEFDRLDAQTQLTAAGILEQLADLSAANGQPERALKLLERVLATREHAMRGDDPVLVNTFLHCARLHDEMGHDEEATRVYRRVLPHLDHQAEHHRSRRNREAMLQVMEQALEVHHRVAPPGDLELARRCFSMAELYKEDNGVARAETLYLQALRTREEGLGPDHPEVGATLLSMGDLYRAQRDWKTAEGFARRALEIAERHQGAEAPGLYPYLQQMADILKGMGDYGESLTFSERALMAKHSRRL